MSRWMKFLITIAFGIAIALVYGWVLSPVEYVNTTPDTLRADYQLDVVLMVAETYQAEKDLDMAARRLATLGAGNPVETVLEALESAVAFGASEQDRILIQNLGTALLDWQPSTGGSQP